MVNACRGHDGAALGLVLVNVKELSSSASFFAVFVVFHLLLGIRYAPFLGLMKSNGMLGSISQSARTILEITMLPGCVP